MTLIGMNPGQTAEITGGSAGNALFDGFRLLGRHRRVQMI